MTRYAGFSKERGESFFVLKSHLLNQFRETKCTFITLLILYTLVYAIFFRYVEQFKTTALYIIL